MRHMRWTQRFEKLADEYIREAIGVADGEPTPPVSSRKMFLRLDDHVRFGQYITVHARHSDFGSRCGTRPLKECFASLPVIARRVDEVRSELRERKGIQADHVIVTSDEEDETWWGDVAKMGWARLNHTRSKAELGRWCVSRVPERDVL